MGLSRMGTLNINQMKKYIKPMIAVCYVDTHKAFVPVVKFNLDLVMHTSYLDILCTPWNTSSQY